MIDNSTQILHGMCRCVVHGSDCPSGYEVPKPLDDSETDRSNTGFFYGMNEKVSFCLSAGFRDARTQNRFHGIKKPGSGNKPSGKKMILVLSY
jgi:hypothetical protein